MKAKFLLKKFAGERNLGRWDYLVKPGLADSWGGPFNGQIHRQQIFSEIIARLPIKAIVETGTFRGATTTFLAKTGIPVYTVESNPRFYSYASLRFSRQKDRVHMYEGSSGDFLRGLATVNGFPLTNVFFYLDAHWEEYLPLKEELEIIFSEWSEAVVMIDDFQVPGMDYGFDDYGPGNTLNMSYLESFDHLRLSAFFPSIDPKYETGRKRGCVVLCREESLTNELSRIGNLISQAQIELSMLPQTHT